MNVFEICGMNYRKLKFTHYWFIQIKKLMTVLYDCLSLFKSMHFYFDNGYNLYIYDPYCRSLIKNYSRVDTATLIWQHLWNNFYKSLKFNSVHSQHRKKSCIRLEWMKPLLYMFSFSHIGRLLTGYNCTVTLNIDFFSCSSWTFSNSHNQRVHNKYISK